MDQPAQVQKRSSNVSQSNSMLEHSMEMTGEADLKYRQLEQQTAEKDEEIEKLQVHNHELDSKLQKLLTEFSTFRSKAQQMLVLKDEELEKVRGHGRPSPSQKPPMAKRISSMDNDSHAALGIRLASNSNYAE